MIKNENTIFTPKLKSSKASCNNVVRKQSQVKEVKLRVILKKSLVIIFSFLTNKENLNLLIINSVFADVIKHNNLFLVQHTIFEILNKDENRFPLQFLIKDEAVLFKTILNEYEIDNYTLENGHIYNYVGKWINKFYLSVSYFNEKLDMDIPLVSLNLQKLNLNDMSLLYILLAIKHNNTIQTLNLKDNKISLNMFYENNLFRFAKWNNVEDLILSNNLIEDMFLVNKLITKSEIKNLDIEKNFITKYSSSEILTVNSVRNLKLSKTKIQSDLLEKLLNDYPSIQSLDLEDNYYTPTMLKEISVILSNRFNTSEKSQLLSLNLANNDIRNSGMDFITSFLAENKSLVSLNLSSNSLSYLGVFNLTKCLIENKWMKSNLKSLNIENNHLIASGNNLGHRCINELLSSLNLSEINLNRNMIDNKCGLFIAEDLKKNKSLKTLLLKYNNLADLGARYIAESLWFNNTLEEMDLGSNMISQGISRYTNELDIDKMTSNDPNLLNRTLGTNTTLPSILKLSAHLQKFGLGMNNYKERDCFTLLEAFVETRSEIKILDLSNNSIGFNGVYYLEDYFFSPQFLKLVSLNLNGNNLGAEGAKLLSNFLCQTKSEAALTHLYLSKNNLFKEGVIHFATYFLIEKESCLKDIDLSDNFIDSEGFSKILDSLLHDLNIEQLNFSKNSIDDIQILNNFFQYNISLTQLNLRSNLFPKEAIVVCLDDLPLNITLNRLIIDFDF